MTQSSPFKSSTTPNTTTVLASPTIPKPTKQSSSNSLDSADSPKSNPSSPTYDVHRSNSIFAAVKNLL
ncbi:hypothetical protein L195_g059602 [Trifolium pratense]|uniref:Uncharacterized protein n=1 Tax=Trifolium pratense TaxID=57577 RepID=A0A2K3JYX2_TRIPR|nr:hypothetical protein L195_g059602 [Trifolium pratense]